MGDAGEAQLIIETPNCVWDYSTMSLAFFSLGRVRGFCVLCELHRHMLDALSRAGQAIQPLGIVSKLKRERFYAYAE